MTDNRTYETRHLRWVMTETSHFHFTLTPTQKYPSYEKEEEQDMEHKSWPCRRWLSLSKGHNHASLKYSRIPLWIGDSHQGMMGVREKKYNKGTSFQRDERQTESKGLFARTLLQCPCVPTQKDYTSPAQRTKQRHVERETCKPSLCDLRDSVTCVWDSWKLVSTVVICWQTMKHLIASSSALE